MKNHLLNSVAIAALVLVLGVGGPWLVRELRSLPGPAALAARSEQRIVTLDVAGMTCDHCAGTIEDRLAEVPGVATAAVRWRQRRAYIVCEKSVPDSALIAAVDRAGPGFQGSRVER